jgi:hypothetical protein
MDSMGRMEKYDRLLQAAAVEAGLLPELKIECSAGEWLVRQKHSNITVGFPTREEATAFAKRWATENPPCVIKFDRAP